VISSQRAVVIAHRGASGYLPEHTLAAKALAYAMGADFLEQDIVASRDGALVVMHDIHLDRVSDVAAVFPGRARSDGRFYVRDFDLDELRRLALSERFDERGDAVFRERFPVRTGSFRIHTFAEELELVRSLNASTGGSAGVYPEIKRPAWHRREGVDIAPLLLDELGRFGYRTRADAAYVQCFDATEIVRLRKDLETDLRLVQLIGDNSWGESDTDYERLMTASGLSDVARNADAIGPWIEQLYVLEGSRPRSSGLIERAHAAGLAVHPYTLRMDSLPAGFATFEGLVRFIVGDLGADGLFTDFPDATKRIIDGLNS
jgi:glycerophosphoryl diester phosphodiesterase